MSFDEGPSGWDPRRNVKPIRTNQPTSQVVACMVAPTPASRGSGAAHLLPPRKLSTTRPVHPALRCSTPQARSRGGNRDGPYQRRRSRRSHSPIDLPGPGLSASPSQLLLDRLPVVLGQPGGYDRVHQIRRHPTGRGSGGDARHALRDGPRQRGLSPYAAPGAAESGSHGDFERIPVLCPGPESDGNARLDRYNSTCRRFNGDLTAPRIRRYCPSARLECSPLSLVELEWGGPRTIARNSAGEP